MKTVRTRFAPSPTGNLHIGGARSALFCYLWAKKNNGQFILRIEDTDKGREVEGATDVIMEGLRWLGIEWNEGPDVGGDYGPYTQSERSAEYKKYTEKLIEKGKAYYCFATPEELEEMRKEQQKNNLPPRYDGRYRDLEPAEAKKRVEAGETHVVRLKTPEEGTVTFNDAIRGEISIPAKDVDDQVLMKSDGLPTYHLANVIDDHLMEISHVIRGEEWLPSTPKHVLLYEAFGWEAPEFIHLTVFLSGKGGKMSKRDGETSLLAFRDSGYLPEAVVNFVALLGWNPKTEEEHFSLEELVERFDIAQINKSNPVFETEKLQWLNQHYMKQLSADEAQELMNPYTKFVQWFSELPPERKTSIWEALAERSKTLAEAAEVVDILRAPEYDAKDLIWKKSDKATTMKVLEELIVGAEEYTEEQYIRSVMEPECIDWIKNKTEWGNGDVLWPMRYALSGQQRSPSPFELAEILGKDETLKRLKKAKELLEAAEA